MIDETRLIGRIQVPIAGLGCNNFGSRMDEDRTRAVVHAALDEGVTLFDTADLYGNGSSEEFLGRALGTRRDRAVIVTKFGMREPPDGLTGGSPKWVPWACDASLRRLGTDRIDVYLLRRPDPATPIADTIAAMSGLVDEGKVREIGCSNFSAPQLEEAAKATADLGLTQFACVQNEYSLVEREPEAEVLPACERLGMSLMPYFPLAGGLLTGKYRPGEPTPQGSRFSRSGSGASFLTDERFEIVERLTSFADAHGHTILELALSWLARNPTVATVIAGATSPLQVAANAEATRTWELSTAELAEIDRLSSPDLA
jgi:aryl-alcohol dehydrogenase-like predicted oxidoreductase